MPDRWTAFIRINYAYPDGVHEVDALVQQQIDDSPPPPIAGRIGQQRWRMEQQWTSA